MRTCIVFILIGSLLAPLVPPSFGQPMDRRPSFAPVAFQMLSLRAVTFRREKSSVQLSRLLKPSMESWIALTSFGVSVATHSSRHGLVWSAFTSLLVMYGGYVFHEILHWILGGEFHPAATFRGRVNEWLFFRAGIYSPFDVSEGRLAIFGLGPGVIQAVLAGLLFISGASDYWLIWSVTATVHLVQGMLTITLGGDRRAWTALIRFLKEWHQSHRPTPAPIKEPAVNPFVKIEKRMSYLRDGMVTMLLKMDHNDEQTLPTIFGDLERAQLTDIENVYFRRMEDGWYLMVDFDTRYEDALRAFLLNDANVLVIKSVHHQIGEQRRSEQHIALFSLQYIGSLWPSVIERLSQTNFTVEYITDVKSNNPSSGQLIVSSPDHMDDRQQTIERLFNALREGGMELTRLEAMTSANEALVVDIDVNDDPEKPFLHVVVNPDDDRPDAFAQFAVLMVEKGFRFIGGMTPELEFAIPRSTGWTAQRIRDALGQSLMAYMPKTKMQPGRKMVLEMVLRNDPLAYRRLVFALHNHGVIITGMRRVDASGGEYERVSFDVHWPDNLNVPSVKDGLLRFRYENEEGDDALKLAQEVHIVEKEISERAATLATLRIDAELAGLEKGSRERWKLLAQYVCLRVWWHWRLSDADQQFLKNLKKSIRLAELAHGHPSHEGVIDDFSVITQRRKADPQPLYLIHVYWVAKMMIQENKIRDPSILCVSVDHDSLEDYPENARDFAFSLLETLSEWPSESVPVLREWQRLLRKVWQWVWPRATRLDTPLAMKRYLMEQYPTVPEAEWAYAVQQIQSGKPIKKLMSDELKPLREKIENRKREQFEKEIDRTFPDFAGYMIFLIYMVSHIDRSPTESVRRLLTEEGTTGLRALKMTDASHSLFTMFGTPKKEFPGEQFVDKMRNILPMVMQPTTNRSLAYRSSRQFFLRHFVEAVLQADPFELAYDPREKEGDETDTAFKDRINQEVLVQLGNLFRWMAFENTLAPFNCLPADVPLDMFKEKLAALIIDLIKPVPADSLLSNA